MKKATFFGLVLISILILSGCAQQSYQESNRPRSQPTQEQPSEINCRVIDNFSCEDKYGTHTRTRNQFCEGNKVMVPEGYNCRNNLCKEFNSQLDDCSRVGMHCEYGYCV